MLVAGIVAMAAAMSAQAQDQRPARGLIVKLKPQAAQAQAQRAYGADLDAERLQRVLDAAGLKVAGRRPVGASAQHLDFGHVLGAAEAQQMAEQLRQRPEVEWVEANVRERLLDIPDDPLFVGGSQWWLARVSGSDANFIGDRRRGVPGVQAAWAQSTTGSAAAVVAVLDTGITCHPDLGNMSSTCIGGSVLPGYDFVTDSNVANDGGSRDADPRDTGDWATAADQANDPTCDLQPRSSWHGTKIAGMLAASTNNGLGGAGINWNGRILPVRVAGKCGADLLDILDGMRWAAGLHVDGVPDNLHPARIINISFGGTGTCANPAGGAYQDALADVRAAGAIVVAAAGNENGAVLRPAKCPGVVGVVALNRDGFKASYSNFGAELKASGIATVGGDYRTGAGAWDDDLADDGLYTLINGGATTPGAADYGRIAGTSFASPVVAGVASLMLSANPALTTDQLIAGLRASARPHVVSSGSKIGTCSDQNPGRCICTNATCGAGILDAAQALAYARALADGTPYTAPVWPTVFIGAGGPAAADVDAALRAAAQDRPANATGTDTGGSGGGGAFDPRWLLALALAVFALWRTRLSGLRR